MTIAVASPQLWPALDAVDQHALRPRLDRLGSSYRKLASREPLREEPEVDVGGDDFWQVLRDGPPASRRPSEAPSRRKRSRGDLVQDAAPLKLFQKLSLAPRRSSQPMQDVPKGEVPRAAATTPIDEPGLPDSPATTADSIRAEAAHQPNVMIWGRHRVMLVAGQTPDEIREREEAIVRAWKAWSTRCVDSNLIITEHHARSIASASSRSNSAGSSEAPPLTPLDDPLQPFPGVTRCANTRRLSLAVSAGSPTAFSKGWSSGPPSPGWSAPSPYEGLLSIPPSSTSRVRRNPLLALRPRLAHRQVKQLLVELAQNLAAAIVAGEAPADPTSVEGNRKRSDLFAHAERHRRDHPAADSAWLARETQALILDVDDALGPLRECTQLLKDGRYDLSTPLGELQLLVDLEELFWGMAAVPHEYLPGDHV